MTEINLPDSTRVWIYQSNQPFKEEQLPQLKEHVKQFAQSWASHNRQLQAHADVLHRQFIILMVDEGVAGASGCSIDTSVHFMQKLGVEYGVDLFDRMAFTYLENGEVKTVRNSEFAELYKQGEINGETLVFDNLVKTKGELEEKWIKPLNESWHRRFV